MTVHRPVSRVRNPGPYYIESAAEYSIHFVLILDHDSNVTSYSNSCCHDFPAWWTVPLNCEPKLDPFSLKLPLSGGLITEKGKGTNTSSLSPLIPHLAIEMNKLTIFSFCAWATELAYTHKHALKLAKHKRNLLLGLCQHNTARVVLEEGATVEKLAPQDWPMVSLKYIFLTDDWWGWVQATIRSMLPRSKWFWEL